MLVDRLAGRRSIRGRSFRQDSAFRKWKRIKVQWRPQDPFRGKTETEMQLSCWTRWNISLSSSK